ncbi:MAG TPA: RNA polymerase sigma factor [Thermoanaerobaculia bacterium]|nr:RNA polymerase sigma factor [Thermoanaerobaculia bacterium]
MSQREGASRMERLQGLTPEAFDALLGQLDPDCERAGVLYETIRRKLVRLFEWRGCASPEDLADETINRVARRLAEGVELRSNDPYGYFCGVAHLVYKEVLRRASREQRALAGGDWPPTTLEEEEPSDHRLECLRRCLAELPPDQRDLVLRYYQGAHYRGKSGPGENNIRNRQELARQAGIPMNALRIRVHRVRRKLESCVHTCLSH